MLSSSLLIISLTLLAVLGVTPARAADGGIAWQGWSETAFAQAKRENRFVLLDLGAAWCHWCHVFEKIMQVQTEYLRIYALSCRELGDVRYRRSGRGDQPVRPDISPEPVGRVPREPGRGCRQRSACRGVLRAGGCGPAPARHPVRRPPPLRARERLDDRRARHASRRHRGAGLPRRCAGGHPLGPGPSGPAQRRLPPRCR